MTEINYIDTENMKSIATSIDTKCNNINQLIDDIFNYIEWMAVDSKAEKAWIGDGANKFIEYAQKEKAIYSNFCTHIHDYTSLLINHAEQLEQTVQKDEA